MRDYRRTFIAVILLFAHSAPADDFPRELVNFQQHGDKPIFMALGQGTWEVKIRERGFIWLDPDADGTSPAKPKYHLWYTGYDGTREGVKQLGYATSLDGIQWTRHPQNPIYREHWVEDMLVLRHDGAFQMFAEGKDDQAQRLFSRDGVSWQRAGQLDVRKLDENPIEPGPFGTPTVWFEDDVWYLFYERSDRGVWLATSRDLKVFTNVSDEPVLRPGQGLHDRDLIAMNQIIRHNGRYFAYYHGSARGETPALWTTNIAVSDDLRNWRKYDANPLLPRERNRSSGILIRDGMQFRLYTMHPEVWLHVASNP